MEQLQPQHLTDAAIDPIEAQLKRIFWEIIFKPLALAVSKHTDHAIVKGPIIRLENAGDDVLRDAIRTGRVQYHDNEFSGDLSAAISRALRAIGARWDKRRGTYRLELSSVPAWMRAEFASYAQQGRAAHDALLRELDTIKANLNKTIEIHTVDPEETLEKLEDGFRRTARKLTVMPILSQHSKEQLASDYTNNMKLWIQKFSQESIEKLRGSVEENALKGYRYSTLAKAIKSQYKVSAGKAKFLARQETSLFMSNYRKEKFTEAGVKRYRWSSSHDVRTRHDHRDLDGQVFDYNNPPVVDKITGRKGNPGTDFNCRCVDIPLVGATMTTDKGFQDARRDATPADIARLKELDLV